ncbi:MAG: hypothetical protein GY832_04340 [Chloroflexi bacterium]|nr:hypothetical protein [Chloroflexota bacterium]
MNTIDKRNKFDEQVFSYQVSKNGKVFIHWYGKQVMILKGNKAQKFLDRVEGLDEKQVQLVMAKVTGNFKRGNER